jgi:hypothetical protein
VHASNSVGIMVKSADRLEISSAVVHHTKGSSVAVTQSDGVLVEKTLALSVYQRAVGLCTLETS